MKNNKKLITVITSIVCFVMMACSVTLFACKKDKYEDHGESYTYYCMVDNQEYTITLDKGDLKISFGDYQKEGTYTFDGNEALKFEYSKKKDSAQLEDGVIKFQYNGKEYLLYKKVDYTVTYKDGDKVVSTQNVTNMKNATKPSDPIKEGYAFVAWFKDKDFQNEYDFASELVKGDLTLYSKYVKKDEEEFAVNFVVDGTVVETQETAGRALYNLPTAQKQGKTLLGWWMSDFTNGQKLTRKYEAGQEINANTTLYAVWTEDGVGVSVDEDGVKWNTAGQTASYTVRILDANEQVVHTSSPMTSTSYKYDFNNLEKGEYKVEVKTGNKTYNAYYLNKGLLPVCLFKVENYVLTFNKVANAQNYLLTIDCGNKAHQLTEKEVVDLGNVNQYNFNEGGCEMCEGGIKFTVQAQAEGYVTSQSGEFTFEQNLQEVTDVTYDASKQLVTWNGATNATNYKVVVSDAKTEKTYEVNANNCQVDVKYFTGDVQVKVTAMAHMYNSKEKTSAYNTVKLPAPSNVRVVGTDVTWDNVDGAVKYEITIGDKTYETTENHLQLDENNLDFLKQDVTGYDLKVKVYAQQQENNSFESDTIILTYGVMNDQFYYSENMLRWDAVLGTTQYGVRLNDGEEVIVPNTENSLAITFDRAGNNKIEMRCYDKNSNPTEWVEKTVFTYTIQLDVDGGKEMADEYYALGDKVVFSDASKNGYTFSFWTNEQSATITQSSPYKVTGDGCVKANYTANKYNVYFEYTSTIVPDAQFELQPAIMQNVTFGELYSMPIPTTTDTTKVFGGWKRGTLLITDPYGESKGVWNYFEPDYASEEGGENDCIRIRAEWIEVFDFIQENNGKEYAVCKGPGIDYIKEVTIPGYYIGEDGISRPVTTIDGAAFYNCKNLYKINVPDTIKSIVLGQKGGTKIGSAFQGCDNLEWINVFKVQDEGDQTHEAFYTSSEGALYGLVKNSEDVVEGKRLLFVPITFSGEFTIADETLNIATNALADTKITKIIVPATVTYVGLSAFGGCTELREIQFLPADEGEEEVALTFYKSELTNAYDVFTGSAKIEKLTLPARAVIENSLFDALYSTLKEVNVVGKPVTGSKVTYSSMDGVLMSTENQVTTLIYYPRMKADEEYEIPSGVTKIGKNAFGTTTANCNKKLKKVIVPGYVTEIGELAFYYMNINELVFEGETDDFDLRIEKQAFYYNSLKTLELPENLTYLGECAFGNMSNLKVVTLKTNRTSEEIDYKAGAFATINTNGTPSTTFYVETLYIGANVPAFGVAGVFGNAKLTNIVVDPENESYKSVDGILFDYDVTMIVLFPLSRGGEYVVPDTVTEIGSGVFQGNLNIEKIRFGKMLSAIGDKAFYGCTKLREVTFNDGENGATQLSIGNSAFYGCTALLDIELPERTTEIGDLAFYNCSKIKDVYFGKNLVRLGSYVTKQVELENGDKEDRDILYSMNVFLSCSSLETITVSTENPVFASKDGILYSKEFVDFTVDYDSTYVYAQPNTLKVMSKYYGKEDGKVKVLLFAPRSNQGDANRSVIIGKTLMKIADNAFYYNGNGTNTGLGILEVKNEGDIENANGNELVIGARAFSYFYSVKKITLPEGVKKLPEYTFYYAYNMDELTLPKSLETIYANHVFYYCYKMTKLNFVEGGTKALTFISPSSISSSNGPLYGTRALTEITLPERLVNIPSYMFYYSAVEVVNIPTSVSIVEKYAFSMYTSDANVFLREVNFEDNLHVKIDTTLITQPVEGIEYYTLNGETSEYEKCEDLTAWANGVEYYVLKKSELSVIGEYAFKNSYLSTITLPDGIAEIGENALRGTTFTTIVIPSGTRTIGKYALAENELLTEVIFKNGLTTIDENAFYGNEKLTKVELPATLLKIGANAFDGNIKLSQVVLNNGLTEIGAQAFNGCVELAEIALPSTIEIIDKEAFLNCTALTSVTFQENEENKSNLKVIGEYAFKTTGITQFVFPETNANMIFSGNNAIFDGCKQLKYVYLSSSIDTIVNLFLGCKPENIVISTENAYLESKADWNAITTKDGKQIQYVFGKVVGEINFTGVEEIAPNVYKDQDGITAVRFNSIVTIGENAFTNCTSLETLDIPNDAPISVIGANAFSNTAITTLTIPQSVTEIGSGAFSNISALTYVKFNGETVNKLGSKLFSNDGKLTEVILPSKITEIPDNMFYCCFKLTDITIPETVTIINDAAFSNCQALQTITLPDGLQHLGGSAFLATYSLQSITLPAGIQTYGGYVFQKSGLSSIEFSEGFTNLASDYIFSYLPNLKSVTLPAGITKYGDYTFWSSGLEQVDLSNVTTLGYKDNDNDYLADHMFDTCEYLTAVKLPKLSVYPTYLFANCSALAEVDFSEIDTFNGGNYMFSYCTALKKANLPKVTEFANYLFSYSGLTSVTFDPEQDNLGYYKDAGGHADVGSNMFQYTKLTSVSIPSNVKSFGYQPFYYCNDLQTVELAEGIEKITDYAFAQARGLKSITLPSTLKTLGSYAFNYCVSLESVEFTPIMDDLGAPQLDEFGNKSWNITAISERAFNYTSLLEQIDIPSSIQSIGKYAFYYSGLKSINFLTDIIDEKGTVESSLRTIDEFAFSYVKQLPNVVLPEGLQTVGDSAFAYASALTSVEFSSTVETIGVNAFNHDAMLVAVTLNEGLKEIKNYAFEYTALTDVVLPSTLTTLGTHVFYYVKTLESVVFTPSIVNEQPTWKITAIPERVFEQTTALKTIELPNTITSIGKYAFYYSGIEQIELPSNLATLDSYAFAYSEIVDIALPSSITTLGDHAFYYAERLTNITFGTQKDDVTGDLIWTVTTLPDYTFHYCRSLANVTLPKKIESIGKYAFNNCTALEEIVLHEGVELIDNYAFQNSGLVEIVLPKTAVYIGGTNAITTGSSFRDCKNLKKVVFLADKVTQINDWSFYMCPELETVTLKYVEKIEDAFEKCPKLKMTELNANEVVGYTFRYCTAIEEMTLNVNKITSNNGVLQGCTSLRKVTFGPYILEIPNNILKDCTALQEVEFMGNITKVGSNAFEGCTSLESIDVGNYVTEISAYAFADSGLKSFTLPTNLQTMGGYAFADCANLNTITAPDGCANFANNDLGMLVETARNAIVWAPSNLSGKLVLPEGTELGANAFVGCNYLTEIVLPEGLTDIAESAFAGCVGLQKVVLPSTLKTIGKYAFDGCTSLTDIVIPEGTSIISSYAFRNCTSLESIEIPASVEKLGTAGATTSALTSLAGYVFFGCTNLKQVKFNEGLTEIGTYNFQGCSSLTYVELPSTLTKIYNYGFAYSGLTSVALNDGLLQICNYGFAEVPLEEVTIPASCTQLSSHAFDRTKKIIFTEGIKVLPKYAAYYALNLEELVIPESVEAFAENAIYYSTIKRLVIPATVKELGKASLSYNTIDELVFEGDYQLAKTITTYTNAPIASSKVKKVIVKEGVTAIPDFFLYNVSTVEEVSIPNSITSIGKRAFYYCSLLKEINVPNSVKSIGEYAFYYCKALESINIPNGVTAIEQYTYYNCTSIKEVVIPDTVKTIGSSAFYGCNLLQKLKLSNSLTEIGNSAFNNCSSLYTVTLPASLKKLGTLSTSSVFSNCYKLFEVVNLSTLNVKAGSTNTCGQVAKYMFSEDYLYTDASKAGSSYINIDDFLFINNNGTYKLVAYIGNEKEVTTPDSVKGNPYDINDYAFYYNDVIEKITFSSGVRNIGQRAFYYSPSLKEVYFEEGLESIGIYAFYTCPNFETLGAFPSTLKLLGAADKTATTASYIFAASPIREVDLSKTKITVVTPYTFNVCKQLIRVKLPETVTLIATSAFNNNNNLIEVNIPSGVTEIGQNAFYGTALKTVELPASLVTIGSTAFNGTKTLVEMVNKSGLNAVKGTLYGPELVNIMTDSADSNLIYSGDFIFFLKDDEYYLMGYTGTNSDVTLPSNINGSKYSIYPYAFQYNVVIKNLTINGGVKEIGRYAFYYAELDSLTITNGVDSIGDYAFNYSKVKNVSIAGGVETIGKNAFSYSSVENVETDGYIGLIDNYAFAYLTNLVTVRFGEGLQVMAKNVFYSSSTTTQLKTVILPQSLKEIGAYSFQYCVKLTGLVIPKNTIIKHKNVFSGMTASQKVYFECSEKYAMDNYYEEGTTTINVTIVYDYKAN